jgi:Icc-related predicted phosphoesterase
MRVHVVSDVHGNADALARAGEGADALVVLGDLLDFVDYQDHSKGILGAVFGPEKVAVFAELRRARQSANLAAYARSLWSGLDNAADVVEAAIRDQYATLFAAMTAPTYATPGNVDVPALWPEYTNEHVHHLDGTTARIGGLTFGFVGGALLAPGGTVRRTGVWAPYLRTREDYDSAVAAAAAAGPVDVWCTHIPPAVPELCYDVVARRPENASTTLLATIRAHRPRWSVFGHVHQPLAARMRIGRTECVNVGHFKRTTRPYVLRW